MNKLKNLLLAALVAFSLTGCLPGTRIKPGAITYRASTGATISQVQSQDPKNATGLNTESDRTQEIILPAGSSISLPGPITAKGAGVPMVVTLASNAVYRTSSHDKATSELGASQKNVLGESIAKLKSLSWLVFLGSGLVLFGLAALFYPALAAFIPKNCAVAAIVGGVGFIGLPSLIVGHEVMLLAGIGGALLLWWAAHHVGAINAELQTLRNVIKPSAPTQPTDPANKPQ